MKLKTLNVAKAKYQTMAVLNETIRIVTSNATFDVTERPDGTLLVRAMGNNLTITCRDGSSAIVASTPFDNQWLEKINGQSFSPDVEQGSE